MNLKIQQKLERFEKWKRTIMTGAIIITVLIMLIMGMWDAYQEGYDEGYTTCKGEMWNMMQINFSDIRIIDRFKGDVLWNISK
ncbi:hypothetical protein CCP3SC1AL1_520015 [Gammaproteobacteria bacterium]